MIDNDKKILVIKDSYALPVVAFLSTCVSEIRMLDLRYDGNIDLSNYIEEGAYDVVLILYNTESLDNTEMFEFFK